jgi:hypothetical protein
MATITIDTTQLDAFVAALKDKLLARSTDSDANNIAQAAAQAAIATAAGTASTLQSGEKDVNAAVTDIETYVEGLKGPQPAAPVVSAGRDQTVASVSASAALSGSASPATATVAWSMTSGPGTVTFAAPSAPVTTASFSAPGTYVVRLTASDAGVSAFAEATITVNG